MRISSKRSLGISAGLTCYLALTSAAVAADGDKIQWSVIPYLWAPVTKVDLKFRGSGVGSAELSFNDLLDTLDAAFMVHVEAGKGRWSAFADLTYLDSSDTDQRNALTIDSESKQVFLDTAVVFWPGGIDSSLSLFGGMRYAGFDDSYRGFGPGGTLLGERKSDNDYYDLLLGARYKFDLSERWQLLTHGDFSFLDSEGTYMLRADIAYVVGKRRQNRVLLGYQYKSADYKDRDLEKDFTYYGPMAGFDFHF